MLSKSKAILSSHRDAATRVFTFLNVEHGIKLKPIVALEIVARVLGAENWQALSAMAEQGRAPRMSDTEPAIQIPKDVVERHLQDFLQTPRPSTRTFYSDDLPPIGPGSVLKDLLSNGGTPMADSIQKITRRPASSREPVLDFRVDQSEVQSMHPATVGEELWLALASRSVSRKRAVVGDIPESLERAQNQMGIVFSPSQRGAVRSALEEAICLITGERGTGKSVVVEGIIRAAIASGMANVFNAVLPRSHKIGNTEFPVGPDGFPLLRLMASGMDAGPEDESLRKCDLLLIDERVLNDKYLLRDVLKKTPKGCRLVVVLDASEWSAVNAEAGELFKELVTMEHARHIHMGEKLRQSPAGTPKSRAQVMIITDGEPSVGKMEANDALGMPREAYYMNGFFENGDRPPTKSHIGNAYIYEAPEFRSTDRTGKWCIFRDEATVDALWAKIQQAVVNKELPAGMVSSPANAKHFDGTYLICVFTQEWRDQADVMRVREILRGMGVEEELGYKRDVDTANRVYGTADEWYYRA